MKLSAFLIDLVKRLFSKTPKFFVYCRYLGILLAGVMKLPDWLNSIGVQVPVTIEPYKTILVAVGLVAAFMSQLAIADDSRIKPTLNIKK